MTLTSQTSSPQSQDVIKVLLADDHAVLLAGLRMLIDSQHDMEVVATASHGAEAVSLCESLCPDVAVLDLSMPFLDGLEALRAIRARRPSPQVLMLTMHDEGSYVQQTLAAGGAGFVVKSAADVELLSAVRAVHAGRYFINSTMIPTPPPNPTLPTADSLGGQEPSGSDSLTRRERQVLELVARGYTHREIAERIHLSIKTIETYRARLADKLSFQSRADLVRYALEHGYLEGKDPFELQ